MNNEVEQKEQSTTKQYELSVIRLISICFIVACHILQYYNNKWAFILNIGVQFFLILSGFLYGLKYEKCDGKKFLKNLWKLVFDYFIVVTLVLLLNKIARGNNFNAQQIIKFYFAFFRIPGCEHFWYISLIIFCYLLTPILAAIVDSCSRIKPAGGVILKVVICFIISLVIKFYFSSFDVAWSMCFIVPFLFAKDFTENKKIRYVFIVLTIIGSLVGHYIKFYKRDILLNLIKKFPFYFFNVQDLEYFIRDINALLSFMILFIVIKFCLQGLLKLKVVRTILNFSDKYSYDVYLTHQIFILGPLSILTALNKVSIGFKIIITLLVVAGFTVFVCVLKNMIIKLINSIKEKFQNDT